MRSWYLVFITALCIVFHSVQPLSADMTWSMVDTTTEDSETTVTNQTIHISGDRFAIVTDQGMRFIIDLPADTMTMINITDKTYASISLTEMAERISSIQSDTNKMIEEALKQIPAEQRAQYESIIRQQMSSMEMPEIEEPEPIDFKATGKTDKIAGYKSKQYVGTDDDGAKHEMWCSTDVSTDEIMSFYTTMSSIDFFKDMQSDEETLSFGFPLKTVIDEDGSRYQSEVTSISFDSVAKELFTIPEGFAETEFGM